jgi:hypothetical protein
MVKPFDRWQVKHRDALGERAIAREQKALPLLKAKIQRQGLKI